MKKPRPSDLEMQVLSVLWDKGPLTVREVLGALPDGKRRAYTTVLSIMQIMEKKGLLARSKDGVAHVYEPRVTARQVFRPLMRDLLRNFFRGNAPAAMQYLLDEADVDRNELEAIRRLIDDYENRSDRKGGAA